MVARGDLGVEIPIELVPSAQKMLIAKTNALAKPVITATQMLRSMVENPRPTRAEVTDVANAILDGTDAIMLSEETAMGKYPVEAVTIMHKVSEDIERQFDYKGWTTKFKSLSRSQFKDAVAHAAVEMAEDLEVDAIITCTKSGDSTMLLARYRPPQSLLTMTPSLETARRMSLIFGVEAVLIPETDSAEELERLSITHALQSGHVRPGQPVVITAGIPFGVSGTNMIKLATAEWS